MTDNDESFEITNNENAIKIDSSLYVQPSELDLNLYKQSLKTITQQLQQQQQLKMTTKTASKSSPTVASPVVQTSTTTTTTTSSVHSRNACKKLKCPKCNWHYKYRETLDIHMREKHSMDSQNSILAQQCIYCMESAPHPRLGRGEQYKCGYKPYRYR